MKQVIQLNSDGYFSGCTTADESPLEDGVYLIPANAIDADAPIIPEGKIAKWDGQWVFEDIPKPETKPEPEPLTYAQKRSSEYPPMADYLDGMVKGDQAQIQSYIDACLAVKTKYPKEGE